MTNIKIKKTEEQPESTEVLADSIIKISEGFEKLLKSGLNERAYTVLLQDAIGATYISKSQIRLVIENLPRLRAWYIKK